MYYLINNIATFLQINITMWVKFDDKNFNFYLDNRIYNLEWLYI